MMINNLAIRERRIIQKIDEIQESIQAIDHMAANADKTLNLDYELGETLYAKANVTPGSKVHLWLGANILLEYELDEAKALLETKLQDNRNALERIRHDQKFTREQLTVVEVSVSRLVNHVIESRKK
jgi:prefoldin subunit 5